MPSASSAPASLRAAQALFVVNAVIWVGFGVATFARPAGVPGGPLTAAFMAALMFGNAAAMLAAGIGLRRHRRRNYAFACAVLIVNIVLTFTDQFGLFDLLTLVVDVVLLGLVALAYRQLPGGSEPPGVSALR